MSRGGSNSFRLSDMPKENEQNELSNAERAKLVCKAYLRGVCTEKEWADRLEELGFKASEADNLLHEVHEQFKKRE